MSAKGAQPTKKVAALLEQKQPQAKNHTNIIAEDPGSVKPDPADLSALRSYAKIRAADMVEVVQAIYPRYDKYIHSKCENGSEYGIQLRPDAARALLRRFAPELLEKPRKPNRRKPNRIQARLEDGIYTRLQQAAKDDNTTIQQLLEKMVLRHLEQHDQSEGEQNHDQTAQ